MPNFRLLPEIDAMRCAISDLELQQTRCEASRAREARRSAADETVQRARTAALAAHEADVERRRATTAPAAAAAAVEDETAAAVLRCAASTGDVFAAQFEAAFTTEQLIELTRREERLMRETTELSDEQRRFAHFAELGAIASPEARAAIYHLWDVDAMRQPCRCATCGVQLQLAKQFHGNTLIDVVCAKCTVRHARDQLYRDHMHLQDFYLGHTLGRLDVAWRAELAALESGEEPSARRAVETEWRLDFELVIQERFKLGPRVKAPVRRRAAVGVL